MNRDKKYSLVILDDDSMLLESLSKQIALSAFSSLFDINVVSSIAELIAFIDSNSLPDVLIADIFLKENETGIGVVKKLFSHSETRVIFISAFVQTAPEVYEVDHEYYLLKPINKEKLEKALSKVVASLDAEERGFFLVKSARTIEHVQYREILYFESNLRKIIVHAGFGSLSFYGKLGELTEELPSNFIRCHKSYVVNASHVKRIESNTVVLTNGEILPISKRYLNSFKNEFASYVSVNKFRK